MPDALAVTGGPDWAAMDHEHRGLVLADYIAQFGRRTLTEFWIIGRGLEAHATGLNKGDGGWYAYLDQIGMKPAQASELRRLARGFATVEELLRHRTKDEAVKALKGRKAPESESTPTAEIQRSEPAKVVQPEPTDPPAREPDEVLPPLPHPSAPVVEVEGVELKTVEEWDAIEDVAREEAAKQEAADREAREERLSIRLQDEDGPAVDVLHRKLEATEGRERDGRRARRQAERDGMKRALLKARYSDEAAALNVQIDDALAVVGVARKRPESGTAHPPRPSATPAPSTGIGPRQRGAGRPAGRGRRHDRDQDAGGRVAVDDGIGRLPLPAERYRDGPPAAGERGRRPDVRPCARRRRGGHPPALPRPGAES